MHKYLAVLIIIALFAITGCKDRGLPNGPVDVTATPTLVVQATATVTNLMLLEDNFDGTAIGVTPTAWMRASIFINSDVYAPVSNTAYVSYNKALNFRSFTGTPERQILKAPLTINIPNAGAGIVDISFFVRKTEVNKGKGFVFYVEQAEKLRIDFNESGNIAYFTSKSNYINVLTYTVNTWYGVNLLLNLSTDQYTLKINNMTIVQNVPCYNSAESTLAGTSIPSGTSIYRTFFGILSNLSTAFMNDNTYIDSLKINYTN